MTPLFTLLEPQPTPSELPELFPSPFDELGPHPLARRAAEALQAELRAGNVAEGLPTAPLFGPDGGKMFGVLVVRDAAGRVGYLRAFSGMLAGRWELPGYVPPVFDAKKRASLEPEGESRVKALLARAEAFLESPELAQVRQEDEAQQARHAKERSELRARHETRRKARHARRAELTASRTLTDEERRKALHALDQESRGDKAEQRKQDAAHDTERREVQVRRARLERRARAHERLRQWFCRGLMQRLHDTYEIQNARGERRPLRALYPNTEPPSGAADCAAPKLLAHAYREGLEPLALAEFWWGAPPAQGGRLTGAYYGACRDKCAPLLPFMLEGREVAPARTFTPPVLEKAGLDIVYEDEWLVVLDKPEGLLSVPARDTAITDSVLARLRAHYPKATGPLLVHRLDLDTSGLLVAALDERTYTALQRQFLRREVHKRYVAMLEGVVHGKEGRIDLPLRVDLHDRPRQIHDPVHGKHAVTTWRVVERKDVRTRVALFPHTGRTHQLRVHAALGLRAPIVGDRLYGREDTRLHLHAEALGFLHPQRHTPLELERPAPF